MSQEGPRSHGPATAAVFRLATPADADAAVPLIHSSGPAAFDFVFSSPGRATSMDFLHGAFRDGAGEFGFRNHLVGVLDGRVVAAGAAWSGHSNLAFTLAASRQIPRCYGSVAGVAVMVRGLRAEAVIRPPDRATWYVAHLGVAADHRGRGIGADLLAALLAAGRNKGCTIAALDVAVTNPRAQALYERLGFIATHERKSRLVRGDARVPDHRRMELRLS